ncbi:YceI family protein [Dactylosporangium siamense]|uniref:Lipid/polyisoprenoid-binding YceI-like domain-containing protein n=1 Tax=Dactylosporangium siamense TaxID=685454 RepID=A0A919UEI6_9ACTN|nr:YceI family protein [Dactylosporangium siamense]GIG49106.1 hypothetical protein Dsi01nite_071470 [Dactylosporangium siamense]
MTTLTAAGTWTVATPTRAGFAARNFGFKTVHGTIAVTAGTLEIGADGRPTRLAGTLDPASVDTANPRRDRDLRGPRFLDVDRYPRMELLAAQFEPSTGGWRAQALLRVRGHDAPLWIDGTVEEHADQLRVTGTARLHLPDAGIRAPRILVGRDVDLTITATLHRSAP